MVSFIGFIFIYILGGITFIPVIALAAFLYIKGGIVQLNKEPPEIEEFAKDQQHVIVKKGWIRLINQYQPKMPDLTHNGNGIMSSFTSNSSENGEHKYKKGVVYGVLKHGTLFCFESEKQKEVVMILPMQDYEVSLFAPPSIEKKLDGEIYGRTTVVRLVPNGYKHDINLTSNKSATATSIDSVCTLPEEDITCHPSRIMYLTCARNIDKEDWYFGLLDAHQMLHDNPMEGPQYVMMDSTRFDQRSLEKLIHQVQSTPNQREMSWLNAILGRVFLATYKTNQLKTYFETKIRKKIDKTKRPTFLDEIHVRSVNVGDSAPMITNPKLLSLTTDGEVIVEAQLDYSGGLTIEIETDFNWSYSSRMKPIRMHLVLAVALKKLQGRMMFKIKAPPTNRYWLAFFEMPDMEWKITPVVADKQIKLNIVTNAIESRIREVMAETFVLPNMNDISFFVSNGKGGIFGEYKKVQVKRNSSGAESIKSQRTNSMISTSSSNSNKSESIIRENPTVPDPVEKPHAMDALKLKNRGAESASNLIPDQETDLLVPPRTLEISRSTPEIQQQEQVSIRRRSKPPTEESDTSDTESIKSNYSNRLFSKFTNMLPPLDQSENTTKKQAIMNMAGSFLSKRNSRQEQQQEAPPISATTSESKKEIYAQRMASMRKRVEEKFGTHGLPPPIKPRRARASSESSNSVKPPLPPRKHSLHMDQQQRMPVQINTEHVHDVANQAEKSDNKQDDQDTKVKVQEKQSEDQKVLGVTNQVQEKDEQVQDKQSEPTIEEIHKDKPEIAHSPSPPPLPSTPQPQRASSTVQDKPPAIPPRSPNLQHTVPPSVPPRPH